LIVGLDRIGDKAPVLNSDRIVAEDGLMGEVNLVFPTELMAPLTQRHGISHQRSL
jgi:hypothetical protein